MRPRPVTFLIGVLIAILALTGCANSAGENTPASAGPLPAAGATATPSQNPLSPDEIREKVLEASANISTYRFSVTLDINISRPNGEFLNQRSEISGGLDKAHKKMRISMTLTQQLENGQTGEIKTAAEIYIDAGNMYVKVGGPGSSQDWQKQTTPAGIWEEQDIISQQARLLETAELRLSGTDKWEGQDCYVLEISPDMEALWESVKQQLGNPQLSPGDDPGKLLRDVSVKTWIGRDNFLPLRVQESMTLTLDPGEMGVQAPAGTSPLDMKIDLDLTASDYNRAVTIEPPAGLEE